MAVGIAGWQVDELMSNPGVTPLTMTFFLLGELLVLAALVCLAIAFMTTRRRRGWRIAAAAVDTLLSIPVVFALFRGFVAYAGRRPTDFVPDPGNWPLLVLGSAMAIWILSWAMLSLAAARTTDL